MAKIEIQDHPLLSETERQKAEFQAEAFLKQRIFEGKTDIASIKVLFTPFGKIGGFLVTNGLKNENSKTEASKSSEKCRSESRKIKNSKRRESRKENVDPYYKAKDKKKIEKKPEVVKIDPKDDFTGIRLKIKI